MTNPEDASFALSELTKRNNSDAFVIFEAVPSKDYVQFFHDKGVLYYDFTVQSVMLNGAPDRQRMGSISDQPPQLNGETSTNRLITEKQTEDLKKVLEEYQLNSQSTYQVGYSPNGELGSYFEIIRGEYHIEVSNTLNFLNKVFGEGFLLENYKIHYVAN